MNPLTLVKRIQKINSTEASLGISEEASWHAKYKDSAYVFVGGIPFELTEGDLLAVFAQYGEVVDVNLVRDKGTGKSKGFAFLAYEDQRSTILAVDNLNGAKLLGRIVRVDHVTKYKKKEEEEDEEKEQQKREERGVCHAYQRGECNRGASCRFSHDEQRCANTGSGPMDDNSRWGHDKYDGSRKSHKKFGQSTSDQVLQKNVKEGESSPRTLYRDGHSSKSQTNEDYNNRWKEDNKLNFKDRERRGRDENSDNETKPREDRYSHISDKHSDRHRRDISLEGDPDVVRRDRRSRHDSNLSSRRSREEGKDHHRRAHR